MGAPQKIRQVQLNNLRLMDNLSIVLTPMDQGHQREMELPDKICQWQSEKKLRGLLEWHRNRGMGVRGIVGPGRKPCRETDDGGKHEHHISPKLRNANYPEC